MKRGDYPAITRSAP